MNISKFYDIKQKNIQKYIRFSNIVFLHDMYDVLQWL